ncbi:SDR family oxidoreductase [Palleronia abyssalis]|uniref:Dihydroanticapsin 7-dehydrogenase n=1 Tax=Palleronia abyssalis TaxID=1501240 RepID=A0A2R8BUP2_9RHOB|nr:SDR family oxidoreductase [Palleronia abyssalis]SPJ23845.1 Dihydroanticapsin 7-dehydrogenase [Palleronia abyssalis]
MKHALITGGANGIGRGIVAHLLDLGWIVHALDRDADALDDLTDHANLRRIRADVSDEASVRQAVTGLDRLDLLVSNAGVASPESGPIEDLSLSDWNAWIGTNLTGSFLMAKHGVPLLRAAKGAMVLMSSTRARMSEANTEAYAATKGGIEALTHALAISLGPQVRVNGIAPGWVVTGDFDALRDVDHDQHPVGRAGKPSDIAEAVEYLAGAQFMTGQILTLDGGMTRKMIYAE